MRPTRASTLAVTGLIAAAVTWLLLRVIYNSLPALPWTGVPALLVVAAFEAGAGRDLRHRIARKNANLKPADPLVVARMLVLARATALAGALVTGLALGFAGYLGGMLTAATPKHDLTTALITAAAALVMTAAALYLEFCCRAPRDRATPEDR